MHQRAPSPWQPCHTLGWARATRCRGGQMALQISVRRCGQRRAHRPVRAACPGSWRAPSENASNPEIARTVARIIGPGDAVLQRSLTDRVNHPHLVHRRAPGQDHVEQAGFR